MTKIELKTILEQGDFNPAMYSLDGGHPGDRWVLNDEGARWAVYYSDRGHERRRMTFASETEACEYFLHVVENDPGVRRLDR